MDRSELSDLILADADEVLGRQESDTIDIVDSIRYHLTSCVRTYSEMEEANSKLHQVDQLLQSLGLDC